MGFNKIKTGYLSVLITGDGARWSKIMVEDESNINIADKSITFSRDFYFGILIRKSHP